MAGKSNALENALLRLLFNAVGISNLADNAGSSPLTNLYVALHTADPGEAGNQSTNEIAYTGYARVAVPRSTSGFTVTNNVVSLAAAINFPAGTGGTGTATHVSFGKAASGAGEILYSGPLTTNVVCGAGVTPSLTTAGTITED